MTHYDITMGNDIDRDTHCNITMGNDIAWNIYCDVTMTLLMHNDTAMNVFYYVLLTSTYDIAVSPVNVLKLYT